MLSVGSEARTSRSPGGRNEVHEAGALERAFLVLLLVCFTCVRAKSHAIEAPVPLPLRHERNVGNVGKIVHVEIGPEPEPEPEQKS